MYFHPLFKNKNDKQKKIQTTALPWWVVVCDIMASFRSKDRLCPMRRHQLELHIASHLVGNTHVQNDMLYKFQTTSAHSVIPSKGNGRRVCIKRLELRIIRLERRRHKRVLLSSQQQRRHLHEAKAVLI